jgi:hypothetical protein
MDLLLFATSEPTLPLVNPKLTKLHPEPPLSLTDPASPKSSPVPPESS